jgi:nucleotide-binding universal stress UspA family protein
MKLLVTTDTSDRSLQILPHVRHFAEATGAEVILAQVVEPTPAETGEQTGVDDEFRRREAPQIHAHLHDILAAAEIYGRTVVGVRGRGEETHDVILRLAAQEAAGLIAMDTRGAGSLRHAVAGSVAMGVVANSSLPVMLSGENTGPAFSGLPYHLVIPADEAEDGREVLGPLTADLQPGSLTLTLLHVQQPGAGKDGEASPDAITRLTAVSESLPPALLEQTSLLVAESDSSTSDAITAAASDLGADAIAMVTRGHNAVRHLFSGSVALDVLNQSPVPVIVRRTAA